MQHIATRPDDAVLAEKSKTMATGGATGPSVDLNTISTVVAGVLTSLQSTTQQRALELVPLHRPAGMI